MGWAINATSHVLTHTGTTTDFWFTGSSIPAMSRHFADCATVADKISIMVPTTMDGRTGFRCGIDPSDQTKVMIRRRTIGVDGSNLDSASHGVPAGVPFRLQVDRIGTTITASVVATGYTIMSAEINNTTDPTYSNFEAWGLLTNVNGAVVLAAGVAELRAVVEQVSEVLTVICGGNVYAAFDEDNIALLNNGGAGAFSPSADVSLTVLDGIVYGVDGSNLRRINLVSRVVDALGPDDIGSNWDVTTTGAPPGASVVAGFPDERVPGTTTAREIEAHKGRLYYAGMDDQPNVIVACAVGDPQMMFTGEPSEGRAFALGINRTPGAAHVILSLTSIDSNVLLIGQTRSIANLIGDPVDGFPEIVQAADNLGVSGLNSVTTATGGINLVHSPDGGLVHVPIRGAPIKLSASVLTEYIQFPRGQRTDYYVTVVRDTLREGTHIFLTLRNTSGSVHIWYDEKRGQFEPSRGGYFPEEYPDAVGPTCAVNWRGYIVMGGKTGYIYKFETDDDPTYADDGGVAISTKMPVSLMNDDDIDGDTVCTYLKAELSDESDEVRMRVFGGATVQGAYDLVQREMLFSTLTPPYAPPVIHTFRSRALVVELSSSTIGQTWRLEALTSETVMAATLIRGVATSIPAPPAKCEPPVTVVVPPPPPPPPPGPGAGESIAPPPGLGMPTPDPGQGGGYWFDPYTPLGGGTPAGPPPPPPQTGPNSTPAGGGGGEF